MSGFVKVVIAPLLIDVHPIHKKLQWDFKVMDIRFGDYYNFRETSDVMRKG